MVLGMSLATYTAVHVAVSWWALARDWWFCSGS